MHHPPRRRDEGRIILTFEVMNRQLSGLDRYYLSCVSSGVDRAVAKDLFGSCFESSFQDKCFGLWRADVDIPLLCPKADSCPRYVLSHKSLVCNMGATAWTSR